MHQETIGPALSRAGIVVLLAAGMLAAGSAGAQQRSAAAVELRVPAGGGGAGTMSLAAEVRIDAVAGTVALDRGTRAALLKEVAKQSPPYWSGAD